MSDILVISGHPDLSASIANQAVLGELATALPHAAIRKLDALYPDGRIDVPAEQAALQRAEVIVWQFPFSWYSLPALMKKWLDEVFVHGFAHGPGAVLRGKKLIVSFTTGAPAAAYQKDGFFGHTVEDYLPQFASTAFLCGLELQPFIYTCGIGYTERSDEAAVNAQRDKAKDHAARLVDAIQAV